MKALGFGPPDVDVAVHGWWGYPAIRGREQQVIDSLGGVFNATTNPNTRIANAIRGVSKTNPLGYAYHAASDLAFGPLALYSGAKPTQRALDMINTF